MLWRAGTLLLRRVLRHDNPAHQALLDAEAVARGIRIEPGASDGTGASNTARPRVKRERGGQGADAAAAGLNRRQACDLTGKDDDAPGRKRSAPAVVAAGS